MVDTVHPADISIILSLAFVGKSPLFSGGDQFVLMLCQFLPALFITSLP